LVLHVLSAQIFWLKKKNLNNHYVITKNTAHSHLSLTKQSHQHQHANTFNRDHKEMNNKDKNDNCCKNEELNLIAFNKRTIKSSSVRVASLLPD
jgi:hypothetical protein